MGKNLLKNEFFNIFRANNIQKLCLIINLGQNLVGKLLIELINTYIHVVIIYDMKTDILLKIYFKHEKNIKRNIVKVAHL